MISNKHMTSFVAGAIITEAILHGLRGAPFRAVGEGMDLGLLLGGPVYGPPAPRPWHENVDWRQVLGGEPLELYQGDY